MFWNFLLDTGDHLPDEDLVSEEEKASPENTWTLFSRVRSVDIKLLRELDIHVIVDLMVENKKVKYGLQ